MLPKVASKAIPLETPASVKQSIKTLMVQSQRSWDGGRHPIHRDTKCVCLLLQDLLQSCSRGGGGEWRTDAMRDTNTSYTQLMREARS